MGAPCGEAMIDLIQVKMADRSGKTLGWAAGTAEGLDLLK